jgi:hypothetical protein
VPTPRETPYLPRTSRADLCKLVQLYLVGGIAVAPELQLLRPLDPWVHGYNHTAVLGHELQSLSHSLITSPPRAPLIELTLRYWGEWSEGERSAYDLVGPSLLIQAIQDSYGWSPMTRKGRDQLRGLGVNVLLEVSEAGFGRAQERCLRENHGLHRVRHDINENNCGHVIREDSEAEVYIAYSRMMRAGPSSSALPCFKDAASASPMVSCSCDVPGDHIQNHFTCSDASHSGHCAAGIPCSIVAGETWDFDPHTCGQRGRGCLESSSTRSLLWQDFSECLAKKQQAAGKELTHWNAVKLLRPSTTPQ